MRWMALVVMMAVASEGTAATHSMTSLGRSEVKLDAKMVAAIKRGVSSEMRDPSSARFGSPMVGFQGDSGLIDVCGAVNGKNGFGGFTGAQPFHTTLVPVRKNPAVVKPSGWFVMVSSFGDAVTAAYPVCDVTNWKSD